MAVFAISATAHYPDRIRDEEGLLERRTVRFAPGVKPGARSGSAVAPLPMGKYRHDS